MIEGTKNIWRIVKSIETKGSMQMAIDEAIMNARINNFVPNTLRFYYWNPPCVSIGYFQSLQKEVDVKKAKEQGVDIVRRYTGGGAVFHNKELTYSLVLSENEVSKDIIKSYKQICESLVIGLKSIGISAEFKPINDIIVNNKKISGNAQTRKQGVVLQHGTILLDVDVKKMFSILKVPSEKIKDKLIEIAEQRVTSIKNELGNNITKKEIESSILKGFEKNFNMTFEESQLSEHELIIAKKLCEEKYSTKKWCYLK